MSTGLILEFGPPIAYRRDFALMLGSVPAAVMLSQAVYWMGRTTRGDGFFYKSAQEWEEETGVTTQSQRTARKKLRNHEWWVEKKLKANGAPTVHYYVDLELLQREHREWVREYQQMDLLKSTNGNVEINKSITESTTDTTTGTTTKPETSTVLSTDDAPVPGSTQPVLASLPVSHTLDGLSTQEEDGTANVTEQDTPRSGYGPPATSDPAPAVPNHSALSVDVTLTPQAPDTGAKKGNSTSTKKSKRDPEEWREFVGSVGLVTRGIQRDKWDVLTKQVVTQVTKHANELWKKGIRNDDLRRFYAYRKKELKWKQYVTPSDVTTWYAANKDKGRPGEEKVRVVDLDLSKAPSAPHSAPVRVRKKG